MKHTFFLLLIISGFNAFSQTRVQERYYRHEDDTVEVQMEKAKYVLRTVTNADGSVTDEWRNIRTNAVVKSQTYKGGIPTGIWIYATDEGVVKEQYDYRFDISYTPADCKSNYELRLGAARLADSIGGKFDGPTIAGTASYNEFLAHHLRYPEPARQWGWQGRVMIKGLLTKDGRLVNLYIAESSRKVFDAEAMRVVRMLRFARPARVDGVPVDVCVTIPISFRLE